MADEPLAFLYHFYDIPLVVFMPPPQHHITLEKAAWVFRMFENFDITIADEWLVRINVRKEEYNGNKGFAGNNSRKPFAKVDVLAGLIKSSEFPHDTWIP